jgi:negative regulator of replication initiation
MKTTEEIKLIEGHFSAEEAKAILMNMLNNKIHFHEIKNISSLERFGKEDKNATKRIPELKESIEIVSELIQKAEMKDDKIAIKSVVTISFPNSQQ